MVEISSNGVITMNRGDLFSLPLFINQGNQMYPIRFSMLGYPESVVYLSVTKPGQPFQDGVIRKRYTVNSIHTNMRDILVEILPEETQYLDSGKYYYSVKMVYNKDGEDKVATIIPQTMFLLKE